MEELLEIKEIEVTTKETLDYYFLVSERLDATDPNLRFFIWNQSTNVQHLLNSKKSHNLNRGEIFRIIKIKIPITPSK